MYLYSYQNPIILTIMKRKSYYLLIAFVILFAIATIVGLVSPKHLAIKITGLLWGVYFFFNLKRGRVPIQSALLRTMWGLFAAALFILSAFKSIYWFLLAGCVMILIQKLAPPISYFLGFKEYDVAVYWSGTITDEGEVVGMDKDSICNGWSGTFFVVLLVMMILIPIVWDASYVL